MSKFYHTYAWYLRSHGAHSSLTSLQYRTSSSCCWSDLPWDVRLYQHTRSHKSARAISYTALTLHNLDKQNVSNSVFLWQPGQYMSVIAVSFNLDHFTGLVKESTSSSQPRINVILSHYTMTVRFTSTSLLLIHFPVSQWMSAQKLKTLGVPKYITSGIYDDGRSRYRFMVMERFGTDLQKVFESNGKKFSRQTVMQLALCLVS